MTKSLEEKENNLFKITPSSPKRLGLKSGREIVIGVSYATAYYDVQGGSNF